MGQDSPRLAPAQVRELLAQLVDERERIVLIGGQSLSFWAERYGDSAELSASAPYTSKDIDYFGGADDVVRCAKLLGGTYQLYTLQHRTVSAGYVTTQDGIEIDFVHTPKGVTPPDEIRTRSISFPWGRVMHPIHVLLSRAANVVQIPRTDDNSLKQLRAAVYIVREFIREVLARGELKPAQKLNEEAFRAAKSDDGLQAWSAHGIDLFPAVLADPTLGEKFMRKRYPQMREELERVRAANT